MGDPRPGDLDVGGIDVHPDEAASFGDGGGAGGSRAAEGVEHEPAGRGDEADEPAHECERLDGRVGIRGRRRGAAPLSVGKEVQGAARQPVAAGVAFAAGGLGAVEESARLAPGWGRRAGLVGGVVHECDGTGWLAAAGAAVGRVGADDVGGVAAGDAAGVGVERSSAVAFEVLLG